MKTPMVLFLITFYHVGGLMFEIMIMYDGPDVFSLCQDIKLIVKDLTFGSAKQILAGGGTLLVTQAQFEALQALTKMYSPMEIGKV